MKKIWIRLEVSQNNTSVSATPDDLGYTEEDWEKLSFAEKQDELQKYANELSDQPYWVVDKFEE